MLSTAIHRLFTSYQSPPWTPLWVLATTSAPLVDTETFRRYCSTATADIQSINRAGSSLTTAHFGLDNWVHLQSQCDTSMLVYGEDLVIAWTKWEGTLSQGNRQSVIYLRRFDERGNPLGAKYKLQAPIENRHNVTPQLKRFESEIGLIWGTGAVYYGCGGCMPNDSLNFVLLDGVDLEPHSEVVTLIERDHVR